MRKILTDCRTVRLLVVSLMCEMVVTWAAQQFGFPNGLVKNSATLSRALPRPQERATQVVAEMKIELTLAAPDEHVYTAQLENGAAIIAEVDQDGIDLVIDVYGPDGQRVSRLDSPNGTQGPEPIKFTALRSGIYKFVVHAADKSAKPGKYVMKVNQILGPVENAKRLAKDRYPTQALYDL